MPALTANTVTLEEVLEVRGAPLMEEELWPVLCQSAEALQDVFLKGIARQRHFGTFTITPETLLLCHTGKVKFSLHSASPRDRSFTAPETYSNRALPSDAALEKVCVYSLGMSLYHAAEFEIPIGSPINLSATLENVLLAMCEECAHSRVTLSRVLQKCHNHYGRRYYRDVVVSLVESLLGNEIPDIELQEPSLVSEASLTDTSDHGINGEVYPSAMSPLLSSPRFLPSPPPPQVSSRGQSTSAQLIGSNHRPALTAPGAQHAKSPECNGSNYVPPILEKYRKHLDKSRSEMSVNDQDRPETQGPNHPGTRGSMPPSYQPSPRQSRNGTSSRYNDLPQESSHPGTRGTTPSSYQPSPRQSRNGTSSRYTDSPHYQEVPDIGYQEEPVTQQQPDSEMRLRPESSRPGDFQGLRRYGSENSVASMSSMASGPRSSMFSDGQSSSAVSIVQGSYAPESYLTDGYESEPYLVSFGSSVSRSGFRAGRDMPLLRNQQYFSALDLNRGSVTSLPMSDDVDQPQYMSVPNLHVDPHDNMKDKERLGTKAKLKTFFGPEFVMISEDPDKSIVNITPKKAGHLPHGRKLVTVVVLNGQRLQLMTETNTTTQQLYEQVIKYLEITDKLFFGLAQLQDGEVLFLDLDVKLSKYAPPKWKDEPKGAIVEFVLYFRVKFYVENMALLHHVKTQHQFFLQLRKDILEGRLYCHEEAAFILAGLALQAETSNYDQSLGDQYFLVEHYLSKRVVNKVSSDYATQQLPEFHKNFSGLIEEQAEIEFLKEVQKLPEYGMHFYKVQSGKKADADIIFLGICVRGVTIYEARGHIKSPIHKHSWQMTKKLSFKKKKFFIEPRDADGVKLTFCTSHYKKAKYLLSMCTAFHRFQMKMRTRLASIEQEVDQVVNDQRRQMRNGPYRNSPYKRTFQNEPAQMIKTSLDVPRHSYEPPRRVVPQQLPKQFSSEFDEPDMKQYSVVDEPEKSQPNYKQGRMLHSQLSEESMHDESPYVLDSTLNNPTLNKQESQQDQHTEEHQTTPELESRDHQDILASPDREIKVIKLRKEQGKGLGFTILGGENSKRLDLGIYVKAVTEGGAAARDQRLKPGDRILAVNGQSLERVNHEHAVSILKTTSSTVELVVSQSPHNASAFDLSSIPSLGSTNEEPQTLEVKPLITPSYQPQQESSPQALVDSPWSSNPQSPTELHLSTFDFQSVDEPVTMISKSISSLASSSKSAPTAKKNDQDLHNFITSFQEKQQPDRKDFRVLSEDIPKPVSKATTESLGSPHLQPVDVTQQVTPRKKFGSAQSAATGNSQTDLFKPELSRLLSDENNMQSDETDQSFIIELDKIDGTLGISVSGGINTTVKLGGIYVKSLLLNGPADMDGRIRVGDRILEVNGICLVGVTHKQAVEVIKRAPEHCKLVLDRSIHINVPSTVKKNSRTQPSGRPFVVDLLKGIGGLGLSLVGGRDSEPEHGGLLRIKKMFPGQPASLSNKLEVGDIILEVNGNSLENATHQEAINMIRHETSTVQLLVKREPLTMPPVLLSRASSTASDVDPAQLLTDIQNKLRSDSPSTSPPSTLLQERRGSKSKSRSGLYSSDEPELITTTQTSKQYASPERPKFFASQVNRESMAGKQPNDKVAFEIEKPLQHQLSDPFMRSSRNREHEPITISHSLPSKIAFQQRTDEGIKYEQRVAHPDIMQMSGGRFKNGNNEGKDAGEDFNEKELPYLSKNVQEGSLRRTMSPIAPLAQLEDSDDYEEEDDDGVDANKVTQDDGSDSDDNEITHDDEDDDGYGDDDGVDDNTGAVHEHISPEIPDAEEVSVDEVITMESPSPIEVQSSSSEESEEEEQEGDKTLVAESIEDNLEKRLTPKEELLIVELVKGSGGLGFTLAGGADTMGGCFVREIIGDPAKSDGRLQKGDQILQVDDVDIRNMKHMAAVNVLRATKKNVKLVVLRRPTLIVSNGESGQLETINLTRTSRGRIGLILKEGEHGRILVDDVVPGEPAAQEGNLKHGDMIVEIGGHKVDGIGFLAARQYLDAARPVVQLLVERTVRVVESKYSMGASLELSFSLSEDIPDESGNATDQEEDADLEEPKDEVFVVQLQKGTRGFGFSLVAAPSSVPNVQGIFIKTISSDSVAEKDGRLRVGDQILKVNGEDVQGLSHARVIGMLRKITTTVDLDIKRPAELRIVQDVVADTKNSAPTTGSSTSYGRHMYQSQDRPPLKKTDATLDLDITLEDKENEKSLTGSSEVKDEDEIIDLLSAISAANNEPAPKPTPPKLQKRDTDAVLSSIVNSLEPPSPPPDSIPQAKLSSGSSAESINSDTDDYTASYSPTTRFPNKSDQKLDDDRPGYSTADSLPRLSSVSSDGKHLSDSSYGRLPHKSASSDSLDSDYEDMDVFDMLRDNSQMVIDMLKDSDDIDSGTEGYTPSRTISPPDTIFGKDGIRIADVPPPLPTTPIPSDDEEDFPLPPPRKESLKRSSDDDGMSPDSDFHSQPISNGFVIHHSSSSDGETLGELKGPLIDVIPGGRYSGQKLKMLIGALQSKVDSGSPSDEFKALREIKPTDGCDTAKRPSNNDRNRYRNVLPFEATRVHLGGSEDYINANHIRVAVGQETYHYIAAQGPLPNTTQDFWQMIWEQGVEVVAMVTLERESGKPKCHKYWPDSEDDPLVIPDRFEVSLQSDRKYDSLIERRIAIKHLEVVRVPLTFTAPKGQDKRGNIVADNVSLSGKSLEITHLNFTTWPDHGVPKSSVELLQFVTYMRQLTSTQAPIVVHCSAGIGRTGALITIDVALGLMERDLPFDINKTIRLLREQRQGMIQTKDQYMFCYKSCLEVLRSLETR